MKRKAFTLIELVVSIALFGLIATFLFGTIDGLRQQQTFYHKKESLIAQKNKIISLLRTDLDRAQSVSVSTASDKAFDSISIAGSNRSLYGVDRPFVIWLVLKNDNTLIRLESPSPLSIPISPEARYVTHSDRIGNHCELFRLYDSPKYRLVYLKFENESPLIVEASK